MTRILRIGFLKLGAGVLVIGLLVGGYIFMRGASPAEEAPIAAARTVEVKSVAELSGETAPFSVVGQVSSKSEATVRAERSGQVVAIYKALGDKISAGAVAAEIENASERAAVLQAQGSVEAAQANLSKITGGARSEQRSILESNLESAKASFEAAKATAVNALLSAYATADNAIPGTTDKMFTNPQTSSLAFKVTTTDAQLTNTIEQTRTSLNLSLSRQKLISKSITASSDLASEITATESEIRIMREFVDSLISALNKGIASASVSSTDIATYLAEASAARTTLTTALSTLSGARQGLAAASTAVDVAQKNLEQGVTGGQTEDVAAANASIKQAQGGLAAARANLEKTIIRAPISGTINSFSLKRGDYVQQSTPVLTVANNGALEVVAYVTENDAKEIAVGQIASFDSGATGVVTHIAPALDPVTKKIEIRLGVTDTEASLTNGQSVLASIARVQPKISATSRVTIPIASIKVEADKVSVFTVDPDQTLVAHEVTLGALLGDRVEVTEGLTGDMRIVTDARGLRVGQKVEMSAEGGSASGQK